MTFSICVREEYTDAEGDEQTRFGVAVTTRLPAVGTLCPFASENGAVATQSLVNVDLGRDGVRYLDEGLAVEDALEALLNADDGRENRQLHGVDADGSFTFSGEECKEWFGHHDGGSYTVAGNLLTGPEVVDSVAETYEEVSHEEGVDPLGDDGAAPLAERLIDVLAAGHAEGGDKREELPIQSAALIVKRTEDSEMEPYYDDLRVDASEDPIVDLRETFRLAKRGYEDALERYEEEMDDEDEAANGDAE
jgi:uncharacterized Ntn-hydrolase superfamily protein